MIISEDCRGAGCGEDIVGLFELRHVFAGLANRRAIGGGYFGGFGGAFRNREKFYRRTGALVFRTEGNRAVIGRIAGLVKIVPREFLFVSGIFDSVLSLVFGKSEMAGKDRDFVGATFRNGISDDLDAAWCLSIV